MDAQSDASYESTGGMGGAYLGGSPDEVLQEEAPVCQDPAEERARMEAQMEAQKKLWEDKLREL